MTAHTEHVAHHFDDAGQQYAAAELGMWLFLATEVLFFGGLFTGYTVYRYWYPDAFTAGSHHLDVWLGSINTAVLLASSLTMALAVHAAQTSSRRATTWLLTATIVLGSVFLGIKAYEYYHKYEESLIPGTTFEWPAPHDERNPIERESTTAVLGNPGTQASTSIAKNVQLFFSFYFAMTGLHAVHMVIGIGILVVLVVASSRGAFSAEYFTPVEMTGLYWHFVDIVWVFLFPLLYLIR
jgi:cytochrome c oxidase subunit III